MGTFSVKNASCFVKASRTYGWGPTSQILRRERHLEVHRIACTVIALAAPHAADACRIVFFMGIADAIGQ